MQEYLINPETMALLPMDGPYGEHWTLVLEENHMKQVNTHPLRIIDASCGFFGSSYNGRKDGTAALMNYTHMAPIAISEAFDIIFFPLTSPKNRECIWFSHKHIKGFQRDTEGTIIQFSNYQVKSFPIQPITFEMKLHRAAQFRCKLFESITHYKYQQSPSPIRNPIDLEKALSLKDNGMFKLNPNPIT